MKRETLSVRDMYADLEKIEARGKRKKDKSKGLFSSFGKKDEPEANDSVQESVEAVAAAPAEPAPEPPKQEAVVAPKPVPIVEQPKPTPKPAAPPVEAQPESEAKNPDWTPLTGSKLKKAEEDLMVYKRWLNNGFKSGVLTKQQCVDMVKIKEIEIGLKPKI